MAKTNPIGVRFREDILEKLKKDHGIDTPQKALIFLEQFYVTHHKLAIDVKSPLRQDEKVIVNDLTQQPAKSNFTIDTLPKSLDDIKKLCPSELTGFDRSTWIGNERQKYGI